MADKQSTQTQDEYNEIRYALISTLHTAKSWASMDRLFAKGMFHAIALTAIDFNLKDIEEKCYAESQKLGGFAE